MNFNSSQREDLVSIFKHGLAAVNGRHCVAHYLRDNPMVDNLFVLALGKAAVSMSQGAFDVCEDQIKDCLLITKSGYAYGAPTNAKVIEAAHPVPDESSIAAGRQLLDYVSRVPKDASLLCLISGGTSSLVEVLPDTVSIGQLQQLNMWLLESGLTIGEINAIRKSVSCIKGGRLARQLNGQPVKVLLLSDVENDKVSDIGSGLFSPSMRVVPQMPVDAPEEIKSVLHSTQNVPKADDPCFDSVETVIVASLGIAIKEVKKSAIAIGYEVIVHSEYLKGDAIEAGKAIAGIIKQSPKKLHVWGGECTVKLPANHGTGGRCQSLALSAAIALKDSIRWCLLAAGTDGCDGSEQVAGACVDDQTISLAMQGKQGNASAADYLKRADAGTFLDMADSLIRTGPTGTNVTDIVLAYMD